MSEVTIGRLLKGHPFVTHQNKPFFASGLARGAWGELGTCLPMILGQLEDSLRQSLSFYGHDITELTPNFLTRDKTLGAILLREEMDEILGYDLRMDLRLIFASPYDENLRNKIRHGLVSYSDINSDIGVYSFWLVLRFLVTTHPTYSNFESINC